MIIFFENIFVNTSQRKNNDIFVIVIYNYFKGGENMNVELMKKRRKELGMTQQDLADKCGLSKNTIYNYENGRVEPTKENIEKISKVLSVDTLDLVLENKPILPKDKNFDGVIALMQAKLLDLIEDIISKNLKVKKEDTKHISKKILSLISCISGTTVMLSEITERILFFNIETQKFSMCHIETFENYVLNLISCSDNLLKNKIKLSAIHLTNIFENEYRGLESQIDKILDGGKIKDFESIEDFISEYLNELKEKNKEGGSNE